LRTTADEAWRFAALVRVNLLSAAASELVL
jgi:hypothetical protein